MSFNRDFNIEDFNLLKRLHYLCCVNQVSYSLNYDDSTNSFWLEIHSCSEREKLSTKNYMLKSVLELGIERLEGLRNVTKS